MIKKLVENLIDPIICPFSDSKNYYILKEDDPSSKIKKILLSVYDNQNTIVLKLDTSDAKCNLNIFKNERVSLGKITDFLVIQYDSSTAKYKALLIELKSGKSSPKELSEKFIGSNAFLLYIKYLHELYYQTEYKIESITYLQIQGVNYLLTNPVSKIELASYNHINYKKIKVYNQQEVYVGNLSKYL